MSKKTFLCNNELGSSSSSSEEVGMASPPPNKRMKQQHQQSRLNKPHDTMNKQRASDLVKFDASRLPHTASRNVPTERGKINKTFSANFNVQPGERKAGEAKAPASAAQNVHRKTRFDSSRPPTATRNVPTERGRINTTVSRGIYSNRNRNEVQPGERKAGEAGVAAAPAGQNVRSDTSSGACFHCNIFLSPPSMRCIMNVRGSVMTRGPP
ncbi:uncharacterized protein LOC126780344 [Nymphalis io]|uniref:uncharacterized protein LOC126780344 n=1 Tax=Inachis io TaxID=171585 RepID=UPI00216A8928|nr:uncharacterized protein LOC126780344 [Nymphalis io]